MCVYIYTYTLNHEGFLITETEKFVTKLKHANKLHFMKPNKIFKIP